MEIYIRFFHQLFFLRLAYLQSKPLFQVKPASKTCKLFCKYPKRSFKFCFLFIVHQNMCRPEKRRKFFLFFYCIQIINRWIKCAHKLLIWLKIRITHTFLGIFFFVPFHFSYLNFYRTKNQYPGLLIRLILYLSHQFTNC